MVSGVANDGVWLLSRGPLRRLLLLLLLLRWVSRLSLGLGPRRLSGLLALILGVRTEG